jgi:hypothetical protein
VEVDRMPKNSVRNPLINPHDTIGASSSFSSARFFSYMLMRKTWRRTINIGLRELRDGVVVTSGCTIDQVL